MTSIVSAPSTAGHRDGILATTQASREGWTLRDRRRRWGPCRLRAMCLPAKIKSPGLKPQLQASRSAISVLDLGPEVYTVEEVAEHCTQDDAWLIVNGKVRLVDCRTNHYAGIPRSPSGRHAHHRSGPKYLLLMAPRLAGACPPEEVAQFSPGHRPSGGIPPTDSRF